MRLTGDVQAVVMAGGKGSRMTDLTAGKAKCLLPVGGLPLLWYPLHMLQCNGFTDVIVIVQDSAKAEVTRIPEKHGLSIKLEVVGIPGQEELGTADSLRRVSDRLTGSDILVVSGDLIMDSEGLRGLTDMHRLNRAALTSLLGPSQSMDGVVVPGSKTTKYKRERDLVGLSGDQMCLFTAEADVEETVRVPPKVLASHPRITVHSRLQDCHLYVMKRWILDYIVADKNISTVKGELMPVVVRKQFSSNISSSGQPSVGDFLPPQSPWEAPSKTRYQCLAYQPPASLLCFRVNTVPLYWLANKGIVAPLLEKAGAPPLGPRAEVGERAQLQDTRVGEGSVISNKTSLNQVHVGQGCKVEEKVRISNCIIMDNVTVATGSVLQDCIICDGSNVSGNVKSSIVGRGQEVQGSHENQTILARDRMMEV